MWRRSDIRAALKRPARHAVPIAIAVSGLLMVLWCAGPGSPWSVLGERYPGTLESSPMGPPQSVELRGGRRIGSVRYRRGVVVTLGASHLWLDMRRRFGFEPRVRPIRIPAGDITTCTLVPHRGSSAADLWVAEVAVGITLPADPEKVLDWCRRQGIRTNP